MKKRARYCWWEGVCVIALVLWLVTGAAGCGKKAPPRVPGEQGSVETPSGSHYSGMPDTLQATAAAGAACSSGIDAAGVMSGTVSPAGPVGEPAFAVFASIPGDRDGKPMGAAAS